LFKRHRRHNQSAANIHVNLGHGLVVNNAKRQRTQSLILRPNGHRLAVVFRLKAILECGDMSPLLNETTRRRVHKHRPASANPTCSGAKKSRPITR
jgi:hypothetical protein